MLLRRGWAPPKQPSSSIQKSCARKALDRHLLQVCPAVNIAITIKIVINWVIKNTHAFVENPTLVQKWQFLFDLEISIAWFSDVLRLFKLLSFFTSSTFFQWLCIFFYCIKVGHIELTWCKGDTLPQSDKISAHKSFGGCSHDIAATFYTTDNCMHGW